MFSKGADVDALRDSAGRMASFGREVDVVRARGQRAVSTMERAWQGPDLQHLLERWRRVEHDLTRISAELDGLARRLHDNADLQHRSSGPSSSPSGGGTLGGGHAAPSGGGLGSWVAAAHPAGGGTHGAVLESSWSTGGRPVTAGAAWIEALPGRGADDGRPIVTPGVPHPVHAMGSGHWIGSGPAVGTHGAWLEQDWSPVRPAHWGVLAANDLGLPIR